MPLTLRELKKQKLSQIYFLTKVYDTPRDLLKDISTESIIVKLDVVGYVRLYLNDNQISDNLKEFLDVNKNACFSTLEEAENAKVGRTE